jgi:HTH-type transcriptional regulator/antitoxin HigA
MTKTATPSFAPDWTNPPGDTVGDLIEEKGMTQTDLARRLGVSHKHINQVINGVATISPTLALGLEKVLGPSASFWLTREAQHQAALARQRERDNLEDAVEWAMQFPVGELRKAGLIEETARGVDLVREVLRYFAIAHPSQWTDPCVAFRKTQAYESDRFALSAWLRRGELEAAQIDCAPYDEDRFLEALHQARSLTRLSPRTWQPRLQAACAAAGVAVVIVDTFTKARANGATRWLTPHKALIQLSLRYRWEDIFWFTLFHEAGHVVLHRKKDVFIEPAPSNRARQHEPGEQRLEEEANRFAARMLIPQRYEKRLATLTLQEVSAFADQIGVAPAIVVGRLQHDGRLPYSRGNQLRRRFVFAD